MDSSAIVVLVVIIVLVVLTVAAFFFIRARKLKEKARIEALSPAERERHHALTEYETAVKTAEKTHAAEVKAREQRVKTAEKALTTANGIGQRTLVSYRGKDGSVSLTGMTITTAQGTVNLDPSVNATVDTAGNLATSSRSTFTRVATGGLLFGPVGAIVGGVAKKNKIHDNRELYLMIEGPGFAGLVTCNPDDGQKVRQFATAVKQAALNSVNIIAQREQAIASATHTLEIERANTASVDRAHSELEAARKNTARLEAASRAVDVEKALPGGTAEA